MDAEEQEPEPAPPPSPPPPLPDRIETERLVLRRWEVDDAPGIHAAVTASVEHLRPFMSWIALEPQTVEDRAALIAEWGEQRGPGSDAIYGIFLGSSGTVIGGTGLHYRLGPGGLEIGYWLHVDHTGRGYATESARALTEVALAQPGVDRVEIRHDAANEASAGVPGRLGYTKIGEVPREITAPGEAGITWIWRRTAGDHRS